jgi:acyl-CoA thioester hydrolase
VGKIKLEMPKKYHFEVTLPIRINDLNYGNHLGVDGLIALAHESRVQYFNSLGYSEIDVEDTYISVMDTIVSYQGESHYGDQLCFRIAIENIKKCQCDIFHEVSHHSSVAHIKSNLVFRSKSTKVPCAIPLEFINKVRV